MQNLLVDNPNKTGYDLYANNIKVYGDLTVCGDTDFVGSVTFSDLNIENLNPGPPNTFLHTSPTSEVVWQTIPSVSGVTGPTGPQGLAGLDGLDGSTGPTGPQGIAGLDGLDGSTGPTGPQGIAGLDGLDGVTGPTGPQGGDLNIYNSDGVLTGARSVDADAGTLVIQNFRTFGLLSTDDGSENVLLQMINPSGTINQASFDVVNTKPDGTVKLTVGSALNPNYSLSSNGPSSTSTSISGDYDSVRLQSANLSDNETITLDIGQANPLGGNGQTTIETNSLVLNGAVIASTVPIDNTSSDILVRTSGTNQVARRSVSTIAPTGACFKANLLQAGIGSTLTDVEFTTEQYNSAGIVKTTDTLFTIPNGHTYMIYTKIGGNLNGVLTSSDILVNILNHTGATVLDGSMESINSDTATALFNISNTTIYSNTTGSNVDIKVQISSSASTITLGTSTNDSEIVFVRIA